jgi:chlorite dismutase
MSTEPRHENSLKPLSGWHCSHLYYHFDRAGLRHLTAGERREVRDAFCAALDPKGPGTPVRMQSFLVSGQKADFGLLLLDADPLAINQVHHRLMAGPLGAAVKPAWSFVSMTEVSEYLSTVEQFGRRLVEQGLDPNVAEYQEKLDAYARRLEIMRRQRLTPDLPVWPATCFYPMNKKRAAGENWFLLEFQERQRLMSEHGESGMKFGGRVTQMITSAMGLDDWEWGVTLWARNPEFLRDIVYRMRFDEASARYAEFGPFYVGYLSTAAEILEHCGVVGNEE